MDAKKKQKRPRITPSVIDGIIKATGFLLADDTDDLSERELDDVNAADEWARAIRERMRAEGAWPKDRE